jgi:tetratricopeptide (TPR) repeat protein
VRAYVNQRYQDAIDNARRALAESPWFYESLMLQGDAYIQLAAAAMEKKNFAQALTEYDLAGKAYGSALLIGRNDASLQVAECRRGNKLAAVMIQLDRSGVDSVFESAVSACEQANRIDAGYAGGYVEAAHGIRLFHCSVPFAWLARRSACFPGTHAPPPSFSAPAPLWRHTNNAWIPDNASAFRTFSAAIVINHSLALQLLYIAVIDKGGHHERTKNRIQCEFCCAPGC